MRARYLPCFVAVISTACHPAPVPNLGGKTPVVGGTIAGSVTTVQSRIPLVGRLVIATEGATRSRFGTMTTVDGAYAMKLPQGTYHLDVEVLPGEALDKWPGDTRIDDGTLESDRDFIITSAPDESPQQIPCAAHGPCQVRVNP